MQYNSEPVLNLQKRIQALENQKTKDNKTIENLIKENRELKQRVENLTNQLIASDSAYRSMASKLDELLLKNKKKHDSSNTDTDNSSNI